MSTGCSGSAWDTGTLAGSTLLLSARVSQTDWSKQGSWWMESCLPGKSSEPKGEFLPLVPLGMSFLSRDRRADMFMPPCLLTSMEQMSLRRSNEDPTASLRPSRCKLFQAPAREVLRLTAGRAPPHPRTILGELLPQNVQGTPMPVLRQGVSSRVSPDQTLLSPAPRRPKEYERTFVRRKICFLLCALDLSFLRLIGVFA